MPFNGSGVFVRLYSWVTDRNNGTKIVADRHDSEDDGFAAGLSNCITRDGQTAIIADIPFGGNKITNLGSATAGTDALNRAAADARYLQKAGGTMTGGVTFSDQDEGVTFSSGGQIYDQQTPEQRTVLRAAGSFLDILNEAGTDKMLSVSNTSITPNRNIFHLNGSVAAPSLSFASETGTGIFLDTANSRVVFVKTGVSRGYYTSSGWNFTGTVTASGQITGTSGLNISGGSTTVYSSSNIALNQRTIITGDGGNDCLRLDRTNNGGGSFTFAFFQNAGSTVGSISYNGTNTLYNATSDGRLKPVRESFDSGALVDALAPVRHNWTHSPDTWDYGLIAQDVQAVVPRAVMEGSGEPGGDEFQPWSVDYSKLVPVLLAEIKSLRARVAALESA